MDPFWIALGSAFWLGISTSISPCPMATNVAAISFIGKRLDHPRTVLAAGLVYTLGRMLAYVGLAILIVAGMLAVPSLARFLQQHLNKLLGPLLIMVGLALWGLLPLRVPGLGMADRLQKRGDRWGVGGAGLLGVLFALSFCPVSAALYFGSLIPIAIDHQSSVVLPTVYGLGTALPVVIFAVLIAMGSRQVGLAFNRLTQFEKWARRVTGLAFVAVGLYYALIYLFHVSL